ncbi:MAG: h16 [Sphingomonas bacterium]|nr:h16 [Sphingomonas bacterium]
MAAQMTVREAVLAFLREKGMTRIFGNPGSTELPLFRAFPEDFHYVLGLQESVVIALADGFSQASGLPSFINLHSAAGTGHAMGAIFTAWRNKTPLIITAGQQARSLLLHDPFLYSHRPTELVQPYVKYAVEPARAEDVPQAIARAWFHAMSYPRGPVFVSVPADDWDQPAEPIASRPAPNAPGAAGVEILADALRSAKQAAIVVGGEVDRDGAWDAVVELAERFDLPVWHSPLEGRIGFPQRHANYAGVLPASPEGVVRTLAEHDLILAIGTRAFTFHVEGPRPYAPPGARLILLGTDPDNGAAAASGDTIIAGIAPTLRAVLADAPPRPAPRAQLAPAAVPEGKGRITTASLLDAVARLRAADSPVVEEAPTARGPLTIHLPIDTPNTFFTCASGGLGFGLPGAVGVALARPDRRTIALIGDGSAMYTVQGLYSAARDKANVTFIIINNRRYAALDGFASHFGLNSVLGTDLDGLDFVKIAEGQGVPAARVTEPAELDEAVRRALAVDGPFLLEAWVD